MEDVGIFSRHLVYFIVIWYTHWAFGIFCGYMVHFSPFGMLFQEKSGNLAQRWVLTFIVGVGVAKWFIFKPKIPIWVNFGGPWN
jgi:hypothetical protein